MSVVLGLFAALTWGLHDLLVRRISAGLVILPALLLVLAIGLVATAPFAFLWGSWDQVTGRAIGLSAVSGLVFIAAGYGLYRAFAIGPVRLVAPIIGAYPVISVTVASWQGSPLTGGDWLAVLTIICGIILVAVLSEPEPHGGRKRDAILWSGLSAVAFAITFATGQAAARIAGEWPTLFISRSVAVAILFAVVWIASDTRTTLGKHLPTLSVMGVLDASALAAVTIAGTLPHPEFAASSASVFGVVTIILARLFLFEKISPTQWIGISVVFAGIAALGL